MVVCAASVAGAVFLVVDLDEPFDGLVQAARGLYNIDRWGAGYFSVNNSAEEERSRMSTNGDEVRSRLSIVVPLQPDWSTMMNLSSTRHPRLQTALVCALNQPNSD